MKIILNKVIEDKKWNIEAEVEHDTRGWIITNLIKVNGKDPKGYLLKERFSSKEIEKEINKQKCLYSAEKKKKKAQKLKS